MEGEFKFQGALDALKSELHDAERLRNELDRKIVGLRQSVSGLLRLRDASFDDEPPPILPVLEAVNVTQQDLAENFDLDQAKLTDACRAIIKSANMPVTTGDVKRELEMRGFDFSGYSSNPLSSIHTTLRRICRDQEFEFFKNADGKTVYNWLGHSTVPRSTALAKKTAEMVIQARKEGKK